MREAFERLRDGDTGPHVLGELEMDGVIEFGDSSVIVRARIMSAPGQQWALGWAYNEIVKEVFDERGIEIPLPQYAIHLRRSVPAAAPPVPTTSAEGSGRRPGKSQPPSKQKSSRKRVEQDRPVDSIKAGDTDA